MSGADLSLLSGFVSGLLASSHCVLMCGGISVLVAKERYGIWPHVARIGLYALLAIFAFYFFKPELWLPNWFLGVGLIGAGIMSLATKNSGCDACPSKATANKVTGDTVIGYEARVITRALIWFWGFLPCPMVLLMVSTSLALDNVLDVALFMVFFGLGTLPALLGMSYGANWLITRLSFQKKWLEFGLIGLGFWALFFGFFMTDTHQHHTPDTHSHHSSVNHRLFGHSYFNKV